MKQKIITNKKARRIASEWHNGQFSPLYAFVSSGAIMSDLSLEIARNFNDAKTKRELRELQELWHYVRTNGARGAVQDWHLIRF